jgi:hypothetical protein
VRGGGRVATGHVIALSTAHTAQQAGAATAGSVAQAAMADITVHLCMRVLVTSAIPTTIADGGGSIFFYYRLFFPLNNCDLNM